MKGIYNLFLDFHFGTIEGIFVEETDKITSILGKSINFGDVLGKHSEVIGEIEVGDISLVTEDPQAVAIFERYNMETGYNPFYYLNDDEE